MSLFFYSFNYLIFSSLKLRAWTSSKLWVWIQIFPKKTFTKWKKHRQPKKMQSSIFCVIRILALRRYIIKNARFCSTLVAYLTRFGVCFNFKSELSLSIWNTVRPFSQIRSERDKKHTEKQVFVLLTCIRMEVLRISAKTRSELIVRKGSFYQWLQLFMCCILNWNILKWFTFLNSCME